MHARCHCGKLFDTHDGGTICRKCDRTFCPQCEEKQCPKSEGPCRDCIAAAVVTDLLARPLLARSSRPRKAHPTAKIAHLFAMADPFDAGLPCYGYVPLTVKTVTALLTRMASVPRTAGYLGYVDGLVRWYQYHPALTELVDCTPRLLTEEDFKTVKQAKLADTECHYMEVYHDVVQFMCQRQHAGAEPFSMFSITKKQLQAILKGLKR